MIGWSGSEDLKQTTEALLNEAKGVSREDVISEAPTTFMVEGNVGVGKSTLCRKLECDRIKIEAEGVGDRFTALFYSDMARYGFALQMTLQAQRSAALARAHSRSSPPILLLDRSVLGDWAFAAWNAALGNLSSDEWDVYLDRAGPSPRHALDRATSTTKPTVIFLHDDPAHCQERAKKRGDVDASVTLEYLHGLHAAHLLALAFVGVSYRIVEIPWSEYSASVDCLRTTLLEGNLRPVHSPRQMARAFRERASEAIATVSPRSARTFLRQLLVSLDAQK